MDFKAKMLDTMQKLQVMNEVISTLLKPIRPLPYGNVRDVSNKTVLSDHAAPAYLA